ncbi:MAG: hypothetical protein DIU56_003635 [Pseudomonadota bacterium]|jgi:hypothetical protein
MRRLMPIAASVAVLAAGCAAAPQVSELDSTRLAVMRPSPVLDCPRHTGTRIKRDDGSCASVSGRAFTIHDIERTGAGTIDEALRMLDPSFH